MVPRYDEVTRALYISPKDTQVKINQILNVFYGSQRNGDVNLCSETAFQYQIVDGKMPNLTLDSTEVELAKVGGGLPNILVKMRVLENSIVNVKWSWKLDD